MAQPLIHPDDVFLLKEVMWPHVTFYRKQCDVIESVFRDDETYVVAGNKLGKDFVAGFIALSAFIICQARGLTCRIITTSVDERHLDVMWGEIGRFLTTATQPLLYTRGGIAMPQQQLVLNHMELRRKGEESAKIPYNYIKGMVYADPEKMAGHHADWTLGICDEASGADDELKRRWDGWAKHKLFIGNPEVCANFYREGVRAGDLVADDVTRFHRKVIRIRAEDSPNVQRGLKQRAKGLEPDGATVVKGALLSWDEYVLRRKILSPERQCVSLDAEFYEGRELKLWPPDWLTRARARHRELVEKKVPRKAKALGCDSAAGGDETSWCVVDEYGILEMLSMKTPNTSVIPSQTIAIADKWDIPPEFWMFDYGGGGKQHVDRLRLMGYHSVQAVTFSESVVPKPEPGKEKETHRKKVDKAEMKHAYKNRRAQMYHEASLIFDPDPQYSADGVPVAQDGYGIPDGDVYDELVRQLGAVPKYVRVGDKEWSMYDEEGRIRMMPKQRKSGGSADGSKELCLADLIGCSPDEADSFVLAYYGMLHAKKRKQFWFRA